MFTRNKPPVPMRRPLVRILEYTTAADWALERRSHLILREVSVGKRSRDSQVNYYLGQGNRQEGTLTFKGQARLDGEFKGVIQGDGLVLVGPSARVEAEITATNIIISGRVAGNLEASQGWS